ncbi:MAG: Cys-tRNA(Pro) deacylase [Dermatophilaceae bacterium]
MPSDRRVGVRSATRRGGTPATAALAAAGIAFTEHAYTHDPAAPAYGPEAAAALGVEPAQAYKTLVVRAGTALAVALIPVDRRLDLKAMASALGVKAVTMAEPADAERSSGYVVGGISPLGQRTALATVLDDSMGAWEIVYVSGGRRGFEVSLAPADLAALTGARFAPIAR